jgi:peptidoglycan/xylan/chitin deacetylase (PgdA/CDA1 family)
MEQKISGSFVISLDFELLWGVRDKKTVENYGKNIKAVWDVLPEMLHLFEKHQVKATFATVGFLFAKNTKELTSFFPSEKPQYKHSELSPYENFAEESPYMDAHPEYFFAEDLITLIKQYKGQEIASHTFSHYYCLEKGQTLASFKADIHAALKIAEAKEVQLHSLVFPRNQFNRDYLRAIADAGFSSFRGNEDAWFYRAAKGDDESKLKRAFRLMDTYINISGYNTHSYRKIADSYPYNIPASRFLRPYNPRLKFLEALRMKRIKNAMTHAAEHKEVFHLWWHPHNFGAYQNENMAFLSEILEHFTQLNQEFNFESGTMQEISEKLKQTLG